jgi:hypothetical protein
MGSGTVKKLLFVVLAICVLGVAALPFIPRTRAQPTIIGPAQTTICNKVATLAVGPTTITQVIPPGAVATPSNQSIFICGWHITNTGATGTFTLTVGSGVNCASNSAVVIPAVNVTSTAPSADHIDYASQQVPPGLTLCVTSSVATISYVFWYSQF